MVTRAEITISAVERKTDGLDRNSRPWTLWKIHAADGTEYGTFDGETAHAAFNAVGERAEIEWDFGRFGRDLHTLKVMRGVRQ